MKNIRGKLLAGFLGLLASGAWGYDYDPLSQASHERLARFHEQFASPSWIEVAPRVHAGFAYDYSNFSIIEGDEGLILVDSGWFPGSVAKAEEAYRAQYSDKPIVAVVYTHIHGDHAGGISAFVPEGTSPRVFAVEGWRERVEYQDTVFSSMVVRRSHSQMGTMLPTGESGTLGSAVGPAPRPNGVPGFLPPTDTVHKRESVTVAGVTMEFIPAAGDISEHMMVWLPEQRVLFAGDTVAGIFPFVATARYEPGRTAVGFMRTLKLALDLKPEVVVPGHGRMYLREKDVNDVLQANLDTIRFLRDQVDRYVIQGRSADWIIEHIELPPKLKAHPDLQRHYHRLDWIIRGLYFKRGGFVGDVHDLSRPNDGDLARHITSLAGGPEKILERGRNTVSDDPRWAASLAGYVLQGGYGEDLNQRAMTLRHDAFKRIADLTASANERNYLLTAIKTEQGEIDWEESFGDLQLRRAAARDVASLLGDYRTRYRAEQSDCGPFTLAVNLPEEDGREHYLTSKSCTLRYTMSPPNGRIDGAVSMDRKTLNALWARQLSWLNALDSSELVIEKGGKATHDFLSLIE